jgi:hypothetical protein
VHPVDRRSAPDEDTVPDDDEFVDSVVRRVRFEELDGLPKRARVEAL